MAEGTRPGWWRTGNVSVRLVCLGAVLGAVGALVFQIGSLAGHLSANNLAWSLAFLVIEIPVMVVVGLLVAGSVLLARILVTDTATRKTRALVTGIVAFISSGALAFMLFSIFPMSAVAAVVGAVTGLLAGGAFAAVSYRHMSEVRSKLDGHR